MINEVHEIKNIHRLCSSSIDGGNVWTYTASKGIGQSEFSSIMCINDECQQAKDTSQSHGSSIVCINEECDVNFSSSPSSIRDSIEEEKEDLNESIEESL